MTIKYIRVETTPEEQEKGACRGCAHEWDKSKPWVHSEASQRCLNAVCAELNPETGEWTDYKFLAVDS